MNTHMLQSRINRRAFTLVEIMLAIALTGLVALTTMLMLRALGTATEARFDSRASIVECDLLHARLGKIARRSQMVLSSSSNAIVLWIDDNNRNGVPDLSELRRIEWVEADAKLVSFDAPESLAVDVSYDLEDNFLSITQSIAGSVDFNEHLIMDRISGFTMSFDNAVVQHARTVRFVVTSNPPNGTQSTTIIVSFRGEMD